MHKIAKKSGVVVTQREKTLYALFKNEITLIKELQEGVLASNLKKEISEKLKPTN